MAISLTNWWQQLNHKLHFLSQHFHILNWACYFPYQTALTMSQLGRQLENPSNSLRQLQKINDQLSTHQKSLGCRHMLETGECYYLPEINDAKSLLFALVYLQHLRNFKQIQSSISLLQNGVPLLGKKGIKQTKPLIQRHAQKLEQLIKQYLTSHQADIIKAFPSLEAVPKSNLFTACQTLIIPRTNHLEDKIANRIGDIFTDIINTPMPHKTKSKIELLANQLAILHQHLNDIAALRALQLWLEKNSSTQITIQQLQSKLPSAYLLLQPHLTALTKITPEDKSSSNLLSFTLHTLINTGQYALRATARLIHMSIFYGWTQSTHSKTYDVLSSIVSNNMLQNLCKELLSKAIRSLSSPNCLFDDKTFQYLTPDNISSVAKKATALHSLICADVGVATLIGQHKIGLVWLSDWSLFGSISRLLLQFKSTKYLLNDTLRLTYLLETKKIQLNQLKNELHTQLSSNRIGGKIHVLIQEMREHINLIEKTSRYPFFKASFRQAKTATITFLDTYEQALPIRHI